MHLPHLHHGDHDGPGQPRPGSHLSDTQRRWQELHHRTELINHIVDVGWIDDEDADIMRTFGSHAEVLRALHQRWTTLIGGCLDFVLEAGDLDGVDALRAAQRAAVRRAPGLYELLAHEHADPTLKALMDRRHLQLAVATGIAGAGTTAGEAAAKVAEVMVTSLPSSIPSRTWKRAAIDWFMGRDYEKPGVDALMR